MYAVLLPLTPHRLLLGYEINKKTICNKKNINYFRQLTRAQVYTFSIVLFLCIYLDSDWVIILNSSK